jgi:hypothetical protein
MSTVPRPNSAAKAAKVIEQRGTGEEYTIRILQYNVNKSRNKVLAGLMKDPKRKDFDIIAIQEP